MKQFDDATLRQIESAHPKRSTWLSANAGSGKTRVLTDRVARLFLEGVDPQHILCLTYTKAAASEMENRLFRRLGNWAMLDNAALSDALRQLGADIDLSDRKLERARTLFARAVETPGGLKIQTIHSFCSSLLRRFPLEAGVNPQFTEIDERAAELLRGDIVDQMADGLDAALVADVARLCGVSDFPALTDRIVRMRDGFAQPIDHGKALELFGQTAALTKETILTEVVPPGTGTLLLDLIQALRSGSSTDVRESRKLADIGDLDLAALAILETVFLTGSGANQPFSAKIGKFPTKGTRARLTEQMPLIEDLMRRIEGARDRRLALLATEKTLALHEFGRAFLKRYEQAKAQRGWLDFDDLIGQAQALLTETEAADWVRFKIDGSIDHILVDEAQDTSPAQWRVIEKLAEEFGSGVGSKPGMTRTLFVVGDKKQSIYSFQGADPGEFDRMQRDLSNRFRSAGQDVKELTLDYSFRSSPAILSLVDAVFDGNGNARFDIPTHHIAFNANMPGRVDWWPVLPKQEEDDDGDWDDPVDRRSPKHHDSLLAEHIAQEIERIVDTEQLPLGDGRARRVRYGDFLILVRRRRGLFSEIIRACKARNLPIAGTDRLRVDAEIAVKDIAALLSFLDTPQDNLSLATALRSPLFGWSERDLFQLAHYRQTDDLWPALFAKAETYPETVAVLRDLREKVDYLRPYELIERLLTRHDRRRMLLGRLGQEAEDGIDALLAQAVTYERNAVPSLTGFLSWLETDDLEIKRQIDSATDQIRVMTVHGAKGLEAPIVILPDCAERRETVRDEVITLDAKPIWKPAKDEMPSVVTERVEAIRNSQEEENLRLLYVALTRAEKWLIVTAAGTLAKDGKDWHHIVGDGLGRVGAKPFISPTGEGLRHEFSDWSGHLASLPRQVSQDETQLDPLFSKYAEKPIREQVLNPSDLGGTKALPGEGLESGDAKSYGTLVHGLLETLPFVSSDHWQAAYDRIAGTDKLADNLKAEAFEEAKRTLLAPEYGFLFAKGTLSEAPIVAELNGTRLRGTIDKLVIGDDQILAIDFKTNRVVPSDPKDTPDGILRQLGAYTLALTQIYPKRSITTAILWTAEPKLVRYPNDMVTSALDGAPYLDVVQNHS
ncbi:MAG: double-strand break repair helicase AddA [Pseudomonadota bacterium]